MTIEDRAGEIEEEFAFLDDWEMRYAHIIDLGKSNPALADAERVEANKVRGCASQVWMVVAPGPDRTLSIRAESDALIVSGLISLLVRLYTGATPHEAGQFDASAFLDKIGVTGALSAQRSNGLAAMLARIRQSSASL